MMYYLIQLFSGLPVAFQCTIKSVVSINLTHVCVLFFCYLPLGITPPIFNMGSMLTGSTNRPATNLAYHEPTGQFFMGSKLFTLNN